MIWDEVLRKLMQKKEEEKVHPDDCSCIVCRNPETEEMLRNIVKTINEEETRENRVVASKAFIETMLNFVNISLVDRLGLLEIVKIEIIDHYKSRMVSDMVGDVIKKVKKKRNGEKETFVV